LVFGQGVSHSGWQVVCTSHRQAPADGFDGYWQHSDLNPGNVLAAASSPAGYPPTQIGQKLSVTSPTLSFHLKELQRAGLLDFRRDGRFLYYRANFAHMTQLIRFLTENCCVLADQGCSPECAPVHAEVLIPKRQRA